MIRPFKRPGLTIVIIGVIAVMLVMGYAKFRRSGAATPAASERGDQSPYVAIASGRVDITGGIIAVAARRAGTIRAVYVQEGDRVRAGQILAKQDDTDAKFAEGRARAQVSEANARLTALHVALSTASREFARIEPLFKRGYVSTQRLDAASDQIRSAEANLNAQKAELVAAQAELRQAEYDRELTTIRAPVNGLIVRRYANPGVGASTLNVSNMFDIQPDADLIVRAEVDETTLPLVTVGQLVDVSTEAGGLTVPGRVLRRGAMFGSKTLQDEQTDRTDERVVTVIVGIGRAPLLVGQRVIVRFLKPCSVRPVAGPGRQAPAAGSPSGDGRCR